MYWSNESKEVQGEGQHCEKECNSYRKTYIHLYTATQETHTNKINIPTVAQFNSDIAVA